MSRKPERPVGVAPTAAGGVCRWTNTTAPIASRATSAAAIVPRHDRSVRRSVSGVAGGRAPSPGLVRPLANNPAPQRGHVSSVVTPDQSQRRQTLAVMAAPAAARRVPHRPAVRAGRAIGGRRAAPGRAQVEQRQDDERAFMQPRVRDRQPRVVAHQVAPQQDVDVDRARPPSLVAHPPQLGLDPVDGDSSSVGPSVPGSTRITTFRNVGCSFGPPIGAVAHTREEATVRMPSPATTPPPAAASPTGRRGSTQGRAARRSRAPTPVGA